MNKAYSMLQVKQVSDEERTVEGMATTPTPDRVGDIIDPMGAKFAEELPLMLHHDSRLPVGRVKFGRPTKKGIPFKARLPKVEEAGTVRDRIDEAWHSLKYKLIGAVSIGFKPIQEAMEFLDSGGIRFNETEILELSLVTIPMNPEAVITGVKSFDSELRAAIGHDQRPVVRLEKSAGASARKLKSNVREDKMNIRETIQEFETKRAAHVARMEGLMEKASDEGRTLDEEEEQEYDGLSGEVKSIDSHLKRLYDTEKLNVKNAQRLDPKDSDDSVAYATQVRDPSRIVQVDKKLKPGQEFARFAMCVGAAKGSLPQAYEIAKSRFPDSPRVATVLKTAVAAGTTTDATWAGPLVEYNQFAGDFVEFLRPQTIIGKFGANGVPSLRSVPFNVNIRSQTSGGSGYWVGQGAPKPLTKTDFANVYLGWAKVANIAVLSEELLRFSNPSAEMLVRDTLAASLIERLDIDFVDPAKAAVANVSPASITNGVTDIPASGTGTAADIRADVKLAMGAFITANISPTTGVWIMSATTALSLSLMQNALGQPEFPGITMNGGTFFGLPVVTSEYVGDWDSTGPQVVLANASDIWLADDGQVVIDASREASLQMDDAPTNSSATPTATSMVSMFQTNSVALRAERWINWQKRRAAAV